MDKIIKHKETIKSFTEREVLFKLPASDYTDFDQICNDYQPYYKLWEVKLIINLDLDLI